MLMRHVSLLDTRGTPWHTPAHTQRLEHAPQYNKTLIGRLLECQMQGGKHMAMELECTTSITRTQYNGIHGIYFGQQMTFKRANLIGSK